MDGVDLISVEFVDGKSLTLLVAQTGSANTRHSANVNNRSVEWVGHYLLIEE